MQKAVFAEIFIRTLTDLLKKPVFQKSTGNWIDQTKSVTKQYNNTKHPSTKLTAVQASLEESEAYVYQRIFDKRRKKLSLY